MPGSLEYTAQLSRQFAQLNELMALETVSTSAEATRQFTGAHTRRWMSRLMHQVFAEEVEAEDPLGSYLKQGLGQLKARAEAIVANAVRSPVAIVCCVLNGVFAILRPSAEDVANWEAERRLRREDVLAVLRSLREALIVLRDLSRDSSLGYRLSILALDISATIGEALMMLLLGPLVALAVLYEWLIGRLNDTVTREIHRSGCLPLIELWSSLVVWLHDPQTGFLRYVHGLAAQLIVKQGRRIRATNRTDGSIKVTYDGILQLDWQRIQEMIDIVDELIRLTDIFTVCRTPLYPDAPAGPGAPAPDDDRRTPPRPNDRRPTGEDEDDAYTPPGGTRPGRPNTPPGTSTTAGGGGGGGTTTTTVPGGGSGTRPWVPTGGPTDYVYLTPGNMAYVLTRHFGATAEDVADLTEGNLVGCTQRLTPETTAILTTLGVL